MKRQMVMLTCMIATLSTYSLIASASEEEDVLRQKLSGRTGEASHDARSRNPVPCTGNTFSAGVTLQNVEVTVSGNVADIYASYSGKYTRQGWHVPCVEGGHEDRNISGKAHFSVKQVSFGNPEVKWLGLSDLAEVNDPGHDSNIYAEIAVKNAINSAGIPVH